MPKDAPRRSPVPSVDRYCKRLPGVARTVRAQMQFFIWADILEKVKNRGRLPIPKAATPSSADITTTEMRPILQKCFALQVYGGGRW